MPLIFNEIKTPSAVHYKLLLDADPSRSLVDCYLKEGILFEVMADNQCIATLVLVTLPHSILEIKNLSVDPLHRKKGMAQSILSFTIDYAKQHHFKCIEIGTGATSFEQLYLYQKMGFRVSSIEKDFFTRYYKEPIIENKLVLKDMIRLQFQIIKEEA